jgi:lysophospholipid acyltransferase (LPLAT)-like uncharacterized protein
MKSFKRWLGQYVAPIIGSTLIRLIGVTLKVRMEDKTGWFSNHETENGKVFLFAFWHNRILMLPYFYKRFLPKRKLAVMISRSRDGQMITEIAAQFGIEAARGSSSKKSIHAFRQMLREFEQNGKDLGITPDGPRGPRYKVQPGVILLSQMSGLPIIPVICHYEDKWELPSWDRFQIPKPFTKCEIILGPVISVPADANDQVVESVAHQLESILGD